jgi:citrate lyase subunit beta / citryl-CoA lyase
MSAKIRRSWLLVPMSKADRLTQARQAHADVVVLDLVEFVTEEDKPAARERVRPAINALQGCGAEVFAQVDPELLYADTYACVWPGLTGVIISRLESPGQVAEADTLLSQLEDARGIFPGTLEIVAALETAKGNHAAYDISRASQRVSGLTLGRADLIMDLRPEPSGEIHAMPYLMQRLITVAYATGVMPIGAWWRAPDRGLLATPDNTYQAARRGRAIGFKGSLCILDNQVVPLNQGFTPAAEEVQAARQLLTAYYAGVAEGVAAIRQDDHGQGERIIDRGTAIQAQRLLALADACAVRDQEKVEALSHPPLAIP